jgi:hypothetical protein
MMHVAVVASTDHQLPNTTRRGFDLWEREESLQVENGRSRPKPPPVSTSGIARLFAPKVIYQLINDL